MVDPHSSLNSAGAQPTGPEQPAIHDHRRLPGKARHIAFPADAPTQAAVPVADREAGAPGQETRDWYVPAPVTHQTGGPQHVTAPPVAPAPPYGAADRQDKRGKGIRQGMLALGATVVLGLAGVLVYAATGDRTTVAGTAVTVTAPSASSSTSVLPPARTSTPVPPPIVGVADLDALLIDDAALSELVGLPLRADFDPAASTMSVNTADNLPCKGTLSAVDSTAYGESGWLGVRWQRSRNADTRRSLVQGVVTFPSAERAAAYLDAAARTWRACDGQIITFDPDTDPLPIRLDSVRGAEGVLSAVATSETRSWSCSRVLRAAANVVIDTTACNPSTAAAPTDNDDAARLAAMIAERIPGA